MLLQEVVEAVFVSPKSIIQLKVSEWLVLDVEVCPQSPVEREVIVIDDDDDNNNNVIDDLDYMVLSDVDFTTLSSEDSYSSNSSSNDTRNTTDTSYCSSSLHMTPVEYNYDNVFSYDNIQQYYCEKQKIIYDHEAEEEQSLYCHEQIDFENLNQN
jgi:hypothetical protein